MTTNPDFAEGVSMTDLALLHAMVTSGAVSPEVVLKSCAFIREASPALGPIASSMIGVIEDNAKALADAAGKAGRPRSGLRPTLVFSSEDDPD